MKPFFRNIENHLRTKFGQRDGSALIFSLIVLTVIFTLTAGFALSNTNELNHAIRYRNEAGSFWLAEAGVQQFLYDTTMLDGGEQTLMIGSHNVYLSKDDTDASKRVLSVTGSFNGINRTIQVEFPTNPPGLFDNTISTGGNIRLSALFAGLDVNDKTRLTGTFQKSGFGVVGDFEDKIEGVSSSETTLTYPDADNNGTPDEFNDFVEYNRDVVAGYDPSEVVYIPSDSKVSVFPSASLVGKKIIYVEGSTPGSGDVDIYFDTSWAANQNVTVISTGSVNYVQPLQNPASNSQLNTISWDDYNEGAILYSSHSGVTYTHEEANLGSIVSFSETSGAFIANGDINCNLAIVWKQFNWENPLDENDAVPPGFEGLISGGGGGYSSTPTEWQEI
ncbi:MAG: hypothetical protein KC713_04750 [Candidatus Omnitrophica bacterium]|nr:hypothetical protein [Candidatus Omnitrophota bacterium]